MKVALIKNSRGKYVKAALVFGLAEGKYAITTRKGKVVSTSLVPARGETWELYSVNLSIRDEKYIREFANAQVDKKASKPRFVWNKARFAEKRKGWHDAELVSAALRLRGKIILRGFYDFEITPKHLYMSPTLHGN